MNPAPKESDPPPTLTRESLAAMPCAALVDFLIAETFDDAVAAMEKDPDARKWAEATATA